MKSTALIFITAFSSIALALPAKITSCENRQDAMVESTFSFNGNKMQMVMKDFKKPGDQPSTDEGQIISEDTIKESDFDKDTLKYLLAIAGIQSFKPSKVFEVQVVGAEKPSHFAFLEFKTNQYAVTWIVGGFVLPLGRTDIKCK